MHEAGIEPDWVIGTSIGAINASLIAGNKPEERLAKLQEFWSRVEQDPTLEAITSLPWVGRGPPNWLTLTTGVPFLQAQSSRIPRTACVFLDRCGGLLQH